MCVCVCVCARAKSLCLCPMCDPMDYCSPGSSVRGILQARILERVAISFSRGSSRPMDPTRVSCIAGRFSTAMPPGSTIQNNKLKKKKRHPVPSAWLAPALRYLLWKAPVSSPLASGWVIACGHYCNAVFIVPRVQFTWCTAESPPLHLANVCHTTAARTRGSWQPKSAHHLLTK